MSLEGEKLAARFSHNCWKIRIKGLCDLLEDFVKKDTKRRTVVEILQKLDSFSWYKIIASQNNINDPFDSRVVSAYWIGNDKLVKKIEDGNRVLLPFHNYTIFEYVHCSNIDEIDRCKVSVAKARKVKEKCIDVDHVAVVKKENKILLAMPKIDSINKSFIDNISEGEWFVYHEGEAIEKIAEKEAKKLIEKTEEAINLFNEQ